MMVPIGKDFWQALVMVVTHAFVLKGLHGVSWELHALIDLVNSLEVEAMSLWVDSLRQALVALSRFLYYNLVFFSIRHGRLETFLIFLLCCLCKLRILPLAFP